MRPSAFLITLLLSAMSPPSAVIRFRVDVQETTTMDDGEGLHSDTLFVSAIFRLTESDSTISTVATFVVESASFRHTNGRGSSPAMEEDLASVGLTARLHVVPARPAAALSADFGSDLEAMPVTPNGNPPGRASVFITPAFQFVLPRLRAAIKAGDHWVDTTHTTGATTVSDWNVLRDESGLFSIRRVETSTADAAVETGHITSAYTTTSEMRSTIRGPAVNITVTQDGKSTITDPVEEPHHLVSTRSRVTRIIRLD